MTQSVQRNHYNVKFLKGYGHSISVKDSKLILKNCADPFSPPEIESWHPNRIPYEKIILSGKGFVSTEALAMLSESNRNVILVDTQGNPQCMMSGVMSSLTGTKYRIGQYDTFRIPEKTLYGEAILEIKGDRLYRIQQTGIDLKDLNENVQSELDLIFNSYKIYS